MNTLQNKRSTLTRQTLIAEHDTLSFLVWSQYSELFHSLLKLDHTLGSAFYFTDRLSDDEITEEMIFQLENSIRDLLNSEMPIEIVNMKVSELIEIFSKANMEDKVAVLKTVWKESTIDCIKCGNHIDYIFEPHSLDKKRLNLFSLKKYSKGFVLCFPTITNPFEVAEWKEPKILQEIVSQYSNWVKSIGIDTIPKLNAKIENNDYLDLKTISEAIHDENISKIADQLCANFGHKRVITIAGPSSSNKTTFAKRLELQLHKRGHDTVVVGMDDYFHNEADSPIDENGEMDWESVDCLNIPLLAERVNALIRGETIVRRKFDWQKGISYDSTNETMSLPQGNFLIMEGIHGLNPKLLNAIGQENVTTIYVQPTTPIHIDYNHRLSCSDYRLIRRLIRDMNFRSYPSRSTIDLWTKVRYGEMVNIFPYQNNAEIFFNSSLIYEIPVLTHSAKEFLEKSAEPFKNEDPKAPNTIAVNNEVKRLKTYVNMFSSIPLDAVPPISCIREFVGGSELKY